MNINKLTDEQERQMALAIHLDLVTLDQEELIECAINYPNERDWTDEENKEVADVIELLNDINNLYDETFETDGGEYMVLTDDEADQAWEESLDSYIEECIYPEFQNETLKNYFDEDAWKNDARHDGRGHSLNSYDGNEEESNGFYIYRIN